MSGIGIKITGIEGAKTIENRFRRMMRLAPKGAEKAATKLGPQLAQIVRDYSKQAGVQVVTGQYLASIQPTPVVVTKAGASVSVVSSAPQAMRLEYGFMGVDALGRHYAQPPFPHWRMAFLWLNYVGPSIVYGAVWAELKQA